MFSFVFWVCGLCSLYLFLTYVAVPLIYIKEPTKNILKLIREGDRLVVFDPASNKEKYKPDAFEYHHAVILDTTTRKETIVYSFCMGEQDMRLRGDLDWMNVYEQEAVAELAAGIVCARWKKYQEACLIEGDASDARRRAAATHTYRGEK